MRRSASIFFVLLLAFAGGMGTFHDHDEEACHETSIHYCADTAHEDCSLCDVVIYPNDFSHFTEITVLTFGQDDYKSMFNTLLCTIQIKAISDRAPPHKA